MDSAWKVYVLRCRTGELYTGSTTDIERRVSQHNKGKGAKFTRARLPVTLVYQERCKTKSLALRREIEIKAMKREQKLKLIQTASATAV